VPDVIPFADELLLGFGTLVLGALRKRKDERANGSADAAAAGSERLDGRA
jgi:hypothetical protein